MRRSSRATLRAQDLPVAIGHLRREARDEINRLIDFLDTTDNYVSRELEDQIDDGPIDDSELEPSLSGLTVAARGMPLDMRGDDMEGDAREDDEEGHDREGDELQHGGDEHDGAEPDVDNEPLLGWTEQIAQGQGTWGSNGHESEQGTTSPEDLGKAHARYRPWARYDRPSRDGMHVDVDRGLRIGPPRIRNLSDRQQAILRPKVDRGAVSI
jgi:hypothetical protein